MTPTTPRPRVICHIATSIDGRIVVDGWPDSVSTAVRRQYEAVHASYNADGWVCGRVTMEPFAKRVRSESEVRREHTGRAPREDFRARPPEDALRNSRLSVAPFSQGAVRISVTRFVSTLLAKRRAPVSSGA